MGRKQNLGMGSNGGVIFMKDLLNVVKVSTYTCISILASFSYALLILSLEPHYGYFPSGKSNSFLTLFYISNSTHFLLSSLKSSQAVDSCNDHLYSNLANLTLSRIQSHRPYILFSHVIFVKNSKLFKGEDIFIFHLFKSPSNSTHKNRHSNIFLKVTYKKGSEYKTRHVIYSKKS